MSRPILSTALLLAVFSCSTCVAGYGRRNEHLKGQQEGADIGRRAMWAVKRGGAGGLEPARSADILLRFQEGLEAGIWRAPHEEFETVTDDSLNVDPLFSSRAAIDIIVSVIAMVATMSAAASGIGGGGLLVPIYLLVMGWHVSLAVPLSNATIFGNAITNIILNFPQRHPTADRPLVDFDLALVLIPMELLGSLVGVLLNQLFPQWLTLLCLLILLSITTWRTYNKGRVTYDKESAERLKQARREAAKEAAADARKRVRITTGDEGDQEIEMDIVNGADKAAVQKEVAEALALEEDAHLQFRDEQGDKIAELSFDCVDKDATYTVVVGVGARSDILDRGYRKCFSAENPPSEDDFARLAFIPVDTETAKKHLGAGQPYETWSTDQFISWVQSISTGHEALCFGIEQAMLTGTDLLLISNDEEIAGRELTQLGISSAHHQVFLEHLSNLSEQDYMLLVYNSEELPWGRWNRSPEWVEGDEQGDDIDLDGWHPDDPNHPQNNKATYVSSSSYVTVHKWDTQDVLRWISKISDYNYTLKVNLQKNDVDGRALLKLTADDLKELGVPQLGPRLGLLERIRELESLYEEHKMICESEKAIPWNSNLAILFFSWLMLLVLAILKGGGKSGGQSPVANWEGKTQEEFCGTPSYWTLQWIGSPVLIIVTYFAGNYLLDKHRKKVHTHFKFHEGDIRWTERRVRLYPMVVIGAGILAGLLGVGGAMVTGPLMLEMNMIPRVSTATSSFLIIFTTGVAAIAYVSLGTLKIDYAIWFACIGAVGAFLGLKIIGMLLKKYNRQSFVIWSLTLVFVLAAVLTTLVGVMRLLSDISEGNSLGFRDICG